MSHALCAIVMKFSRSAPDHNNNNNNNHHHHSMSRQVAWPRGHGAKPPHYRGSTQDFFTIDEKIGAGRRVVQLDVLEDD